MLGHLGDGGTAEYWDVLPASAFQVIPPPVTSLGGNICGKSGGKDPGVVKGTGDRHPIKFDIENGSKSSQTTSNLRKII